MILEPQQQRAHPVGNHSEGLLDMVGIGVRAKWRAEPAQEVIP